ncbi:MAG: rRNA (guanosine2251-2-O)-methyltransferase, partial [Actinomycetota bacterium]|nr:rRNA (guanosine2251-2-O)-methyltransferase [Actinomycetota bacterium]
RELLAAGRRRAREVWFAAEAGESAILAEIGDLAAAARVPVRVVPRGRLDAAARTDANQGVLARAEPLPEADLADLVAAGQTPAPYLLVLDGVTDPHNLGALLRTAVGAGVTGAVLGRHRSAHVTPTVTKAAAGAVEHLPIALVPGIPSALAELGRAGVWTVGLAADGERTVDDLDLGDQPLALVLGSEGRGLSRLARDRCDLVARIPLRGPLESLNVASAGAVAAFTFARGRAL